VIRLFCLYSTLERLPIFRLPTFGVTGPPNAISYTSRSSPLQQCQHCYDDISLLIEMGSWSAFLRLRPKQDQKQLNFIQTIINHKNAQTMFRSYVKTSNKAHSLQVNRANVKATILFCPRAVNIYTMP